MTGAAGPTILARFFVAYIRHIAPAQAGGRLAQVYREIRGEVPRVPNLMQVFSLRPETMEGVYRLWLAIMWSGRTPRQLKELLAVVVAKASRCDYCAEAHMIYLLASGMESDKAWDADSNLGEAAGLSAAEREAVRFAVRITAEPRAVRAADRARLAEIWPSVEERVEIVATIAAFSSVTRVANALGVVSEIPSALRRFESGRRGVIALLARISAISLDLDEKPVFGDPPERNREALRLLFLDQLGFSSLPPGFELLEACPELFDGQLRTVKKSVAVMPRDRWMRIGLVVGRLTGCDFFATNCADWLTQRGESADDLIAAGEGSPSSLPDGEHACLRFARDFTLHSHTIGEDRIVELRRLGLSDGAILDLAYVTGTFNGMVCLVLGLAPFQDRQAASSAKESG